MKFSFVLVSAMLAIVPIASMGITFFVPILIPKYVNGIAIMKLSLWIVVVEAAGLPLNALFATGRAWLYGRGVLAGILLFIVSAFVLTPALGGMTAVVLGSLIGRVARVAACYCELFFIMRRETYSKPAQPVDWNSRK
jgi:hypothetical protein